MAEPAAHFTADTAPARRNRTVLEEHLRAERAGDLAATLATMVAEPYLSTGTGHDALGRAAVAAAYASRFRDVPDQHFEIVRSVVTDRLAALEGYIHATPQGQFFGLPAHGKRTRFQAAIWIAFADGLLAGERAYYDTAELRRQLAEGAA